MPEEAVVAPTNADFVSARKHSVAGHLLTAPLAALRDAVRAWAIAPQFAARIEYRIDERGKRHLMSERPYFLRERLLSKIQTARYVFREGLRLRLAKSVCVRHIHDEGFMANLLHALEVFQRVRPDARVHVDWSLTGAERGFRYGRVGDNVWTGLFRQLDSPTAERPFIAEAELDYALWGTGKDYLEGRALQRHRHRYHRTLSERIAVTNARVLEVVGDISERSLRGRFAIGVHRRVHNASLPSLQRDGVVPSLAQFIDAVRAVVPADSSDWVVFLATDDANTVPVLRAAFGSRLVVREGVQRTTADESEVHYREWHRLSLADAEDVLIDMLLLARCDVLFHASSSISTTAALFNPNLRLVRVKGAG